MRSLKVIFEGLPTGLSDWKSQAAPPLMLMLSGGVSLNAVEQWLYDSLPHLVGLQTGCGCRVADLQFIA